ncbi:MAG: ribbon-helix-helix domain-containing protein [Pseudomonadota bacterium]
MDLRFQQDFSKPKKYSVVISGHKTSITVETGFWDHLKIIAKKYNQSIATLISDIDKARSNYCSQSGGDKSDGDICGLSSAVRVFVLHEVLANRET